MPFSNLFEELSLSGGHLLGGQAAVFDAAAVDSVWACSRLAAGAAQGQSAHWPSTASLLAVQEEALLPASRSDVMDTLRPHLRLLDGMAASSKVSERDISLLHNLVRHSRAMRTGETGFASGTSAIAIMSAMGPLGAHVAIDPFQPAYNRWGVRGAAAFAERRAGAAPGLAAPRFLHVNETAGLGLAWLHKRRQCFDLFFMDDGHKFDDNIVELYYVTKMLSVGGLLLLHDTWMPSVKATTEFIIENFRFLEILPMAGCCIQVFVKRRSDRRAWDHYRTFDAKGVADPKAPTRSAVDVHLCDGARDTKNSRWCASMRDKCEDESIAKRCNATCHDC